MGCGKAKAIIVSTPSSSTKGNKHTQETSQKLDRHSIEKAYVEPPKSDVAPKSDEAPEKADL